MEGRYLGAPTEKHASPAVRRAVVVRLLLLGGGLVATGVLFFVASTRVSEPAALFVAVAATLSLLAGLWAFGQSRREEKDRQTIVAATLAPAERRPGAWTAAVGTASALEDTMDSPLSGRPMLACSYQVRESDPLREERSRASRSRRVGQVDKSGSLRYEGYHLVRTGIETAGGVVELFGFPDLRPMGPAGLTAGTPFRLDEVSEKRRFWPPLFLSRARILGAVQDRLHVDWRHRKVDDPYRIRRLEYLLRPGEKVCVCGRLDRGRLVPAPDRPRGLPVYPGDPEEVERKLRESVQTLRVIGWSAVVLAGALFAGGVWLGPLVS